MFESFHARQGCYCAFCKSHRLIYRKRNVSAINVFATALIASAFMFLLWHKFDPRVVVIWMMCVSAAEIFIKVRWRLSVVCRQCGFDPVLYKTHPDLALKKVKNQLNIRKESPKYLLARQLNLPKINEKKARALETKEKGSLVSRSV